MPMKKSSPELDMLAAMLPNGSGIEIQEKLGQNDFVESATLPVDGLEWRFNRDNRYEVSPKQYLESIGFVFGEIDDIFIDVQLPEGWEVKPTDHSMWSELLDDKGRHRAGIFYKAAFYDRSAHFDLVRRFGRGEIYETMEGYTENAITCQVTDGDKTIYTTKPYEYEEKYEGDYWDIQKKAEQDAQQWLEDKYPDWENPMAYWDD